jgi:hypothetical protein
VVRGEERRGRLVRGGYVGKFYAILNEVYCSAYIRYLPFSF